MPQSLANVLVHLIYSTKLRQRWLTDDVREQLHAVKGRTLLDLDCSPIKIGSVEDHVHVFFALSRNYAIKTVVQTLKTESSKWLKQQDRSLKEFHWQGGESKRSEVIRYIQRQREHHRRMSYQEEFRQLCRKHGIEIDEQCVWD